MRLVLICVLALFAAPAMLASGMVPGQPPTEFQLGQNAPNPFCADPQVAGSSATEIQFALPLRTEIRLTVWSPDTTTVVRTLVYGVLSAGYHSVWWDGRDTGGQLVADGRHVDEVVAPHHHPAAVTGDFLV